MQDIGIIPPESDETCVSREALEPMIPNHREALEPYDSKSFLTNPICIMTSLPPSLVVLALYGSVQLTGMTDARTEFRRIFIWEI